MMMMCDNDYDNDHGDQSEGQVIPSRYDNDEC